MPPNWDMTRNELVIGTTAPNGYINYDFELLFNIVFSDAGIMNGRPVEDTIKALLPLVENVVLKLEAKTGDIMRARRA